MLYANGLNNEEIREWQKPLNSIIHNKPEDMEIVVCSGAKINLMPTRVNKFKEKIIF